MTEWRKVKLGDVSCYVNDKIDIASFDNSLYISTDSMLSDKGGITAPESIPTTGKVTKYQFEDILVSNIRPYFKKIWKSNRDGGCSNDVLVFRRNPTMILPTFLYYVLSCDSFFEHMMAGANGTKMPRGNKKLILNYTFGLPDLETQRRIAEVLSRYDALIENYQRQIKLLEEAAQRLYKEWFVDLRFPGHQSTPIINNLPQSWQKKKLIELVNVQYGYAFDGSLFNSDKKGMPIVRIRNIPDGYTSDYTTEEASPEYVVRNGDILVGMDGIFHINSWSGGNALLVQRACSFRPKAEELRGFVFQAIKEPIKYFEKTLVGSTVAHLGKKHIDSIELLVPNNKELFEPFTRFFNQRQGLLAQIRNLSEARDRLLSKLMSAEIDV